MSIRIGVMGLGDIANKAYLPILASTENIEVVLCTRDRNKLKQLSEKYRISETVETIEELLASGIHAAFVHTSTSSHAAIVEQLILNGIHVYVDKPISYHYEESKRIVELAEKAGVILMVGFNRRFAPMYRDLKNKAGRWIQLQKHRISQPDLARRFIFDDFIHVVDSIRYLAPGEIKETHITCYVQDGLLYQVMLHLTGEGFSCTGVMNRDSGSNEESLAYINSGNKWVVDGLNTTTHFVNGEEHRHQFNDWTPVLSRRGFQQVIDHFLDCVTGKATPDMTSRDSLESHRICHMIVEHAEQQGALPWEGE